MLGFAFFLCGPAASQAPALGEVAYRQAVKDILSPLRLLCIAAHPDDEDGASLAYYRFHHGVETHVAIATRGEGGQNEIGPELYDDLAAIRTAEMEAAAQIEGAQLHFLDLPEFGFSKTLEETKAIWGAEETLRRVVRLIRTVRPHVLITHHGRMLDHGHHQAIGAATIAAFAAAADPDQFSALEEEGLKAWQVSRFYIRNWEQNPESVQTPISALDRSRGVTYAEIAASALEAHASQGMQFFIDRLLSGRPTAYYDLIESAEPESELKLDDRYGPLFAGMAFKPTQGDGPPSLRYTLYDQHRSFRLLKSSPPAHTMVQGILDLPFDDAIYEGSLEEPAKLREKAFQLAAIAAAWQLRVTTNDQRVTPGQRLEVEATLTDYDQPEGDTVRFSGAAFQQALDEAREGLNAQRQAIFRQTIVIPANQPLTEPAGQFVFAPHYRNDQITVEAIVEVDGRAYPIQETLRLPVAPPVRPQFLGAPYLVRAGAARQIQIAFTRHRPGAGVEQVAIEGPEGWTITPAKMEIAFAAEDETQIRSVRVTPPAVLPPGEHSLHIHVDQQAYTATAAVRIAEVAVDRDRRIGLIDHHDTTLGHTLRELQISFDALGPGDFDPESLDRFDAILVDMRAYRYREDLIASNRALLAWVERGGTLIVMYQKTFEWRDEFAPYPLRISRNRVTQADASVDMLHPDHAFFQHPNGITETDWDGWVQERGLYFADKWDDAYTPLIAMSDPGEHIPPGSLLVAKHGAGRYIYTGLVWYRQLRALHPGALRLFANLVAL